MIVIHDENNQVVTAKIRYRTRTKSFEAVPARIAQRQTPKDDLFNLSELRAEADRGR